MRSPISNRAALQWRNQTPSPRWHFEVQHLVSARVWKPRLPWWKKLPSHRLIWFGQTMPTACWISRPQNRRPLKNRVLTKQTSPILEHKCYVCDQTWYEPIFGVKQTLIWRFLLCLFCHVFFSFQHLPCTGRKQQGGVSVGEMLYHMALKNITL